TLVTFDSSLGYWPNGAMRKVTLGNGLTETSAYNDRLQLCRLGLNDAGSSYASCTDSLPSGNIADFTNCYGLAFTSTCSGTSSTSNNGSMSNWNAVSPGTRSFTRSYSYDSLNRLSGLSDSTSGNPCPGLVWTYDAWGNRKDQTNSPGSACGEWHSTYDSSNHI